VKRTTECSGAEQRTAAAGHNERPDNPDMCRGQPNDRAAKGEQEEEEFTLWRRQAAACVPRSARWNQLHEMDATSREMEASTRASATSC
jgi:hypothetical protein